jgi:transposase
MSSEELRRVGVLARVKSKEVKLSEAATMLGISYRQAKRVWRRYRKHGASGLMHGNAGKESNRAKPAKLRRKVLGLIRNKYSGGGQERFGPTLAAEHLAADDGIAIGVETLRQWMLEEGLWSRERKRKQYRKRRDRRGHFGELVQMDGSVEAWLEGRSERGCLINMVDDATSRGLGLFAEEETTWGAADTLRAWVESYGIPRALYVDWKNVYRPTPNARQRREGETPVSQFGRMCAKLGIELIMANSPQAKGRVERSHGTHQDRLIKKMRLKNIRSYEAANEYLRQVYFPQHNARYAVEAAEAVDFHNAPTGLNLEDMFCLEEERVVSNDWVVQYDNRWLQIEEDQRTAVGAGARVMVRQLRDGTLKLLYGVRGIGWRELANRPQKPKVDRVISPRVAPAFKPGVDHPWRRSYSGIRAAGRRQ